MKMKPQVHCEVCDGLLQLQFEWVETKKYCPCCLTKSKTPSECPISSLRYLAPKPQLPRRIKSLPGQLELF
ncbi:MAG: hypothetical protein ABGX16_23985 [Pirellulales bacterium]